MFGVEWVCLVLEGWVCLVLSVWAVLEGWVCLMYFRSVGCFGPYRWCVHVWH